MAGLDRLTESDRELLMAHYWDELSGAQCAQLVGCSMSAIWVRLHRARRALKTVLLAEAADPTLPVDSVPAAGRHALSAVRPQGETS